MYLDKYSEDVLHIVISSELFQGVGVDARRITKLVNAWHDTMIVASWMCGVGAGTLLPHYSSGCVGIDRDHNPIVRGLTFPGRLDDK